MTLRSMTILDELVDGVREDLAADRAACPESELRARLADAPPTRSFAEAIRIPSGGRGAEGARIRVIAEVKRASPAKGVIAEVFEPGAVATRYEVGGAAAVSVLTERRRFLGHLDHLRSVRRAVNLPILRKEFIFDPYQVIEARVVGADAVLLIAAILCGNEIADLRAMAEELGMDALVEVYDEEELDRVFGAGARLLGVNNRNLKTFETDSRHTIQVLSAVSPERRRNIVCISESGIFGWKDVAPIADAGVDAVLVGESLMRAASPEALLRELRGLDAGKL